MITNSKNKVTIPFFDKKTDLLSTKIYNKQYDIDLFMLCTGCNEDSRDIVTSLLNKEKNLVTNEMASNAMEKYTKLTKSNVMNKEGIFRWDAIDGTNLKMQSFEFPPNQYMDAPDLPLHYIDTEKYDTNAFLSTSYASVDSAFSKFDWLSWFYTSQIVRGMSYEFKRIMFNRIEWSDGAIGVPRETPTYQYHTYGGDLDFIGAAMTVPFDIRNPDVKQFPPKSFDSRFLFWVLYFQQVKQTVFAGLDKKRGMVIEHFINTPSEYDLFVKNFAGPGNWGNIEDYLDKTDHSNLGIMNRSNRPFEDMIRNAKKFLKLSGDLNNYEKIGNNEWALLIREDLIHKVMKRDRNQLYLFVGNNSMGLQNAINMPEKKYYKIEDTYLFDVGTVKTVNRPDGIDLFSCFKQDIFFYHFPKEEYRKSGIYRYDKEGVIYVFDGQKRSDRPVYLKDFISKLSKFGYGKSGYTFGQLIKDYGSNKYYEEIINSMFSNIYVAGKNDRREKNFTQVVKRIKALIEAEVVEYNTITSYGLNKGKYNLADPVGIYSYLWAPIVELVAQIATGWLPEKATESTDIQATLLISIFGKDTLKKLINVDANDLNTVMTKVSDIIGDDDDYATTMKRFIGHEKNDINMALQFLIKDKMVNDDLFQLLSNNNVPLPGKQMFYRTWVTLTDSAGFSMKGSRVLMETTPFSRTIIDRRNARAVFLIELACAVADVEPSLSLMLRFVNYDKTAVHMTTKYCEVSDFEINKENRFDSFEGKIIPFMVKDSSWELIKDKAIIPPSGKFHSKYVKHAEDEILCRKPWIIPSKSPVLEKFIRANRMKYPIKIYEHYKKKDMRIPVRFNRAYRGQQTAYDQTKEMFCAVTEMAAPFNKIHDSLYPKPAILTKTIFE